MESTDGISSTHALKFADIGTDKENGGDNDTKCSRRYWFFLRKLPEVQIYIYFRKIARSTLQVILVSHFFPPLIIPVYHSFLQ